MIIKDFVLDGVVVMKDAVLAKKDVVMGTGTGTTIQADAVMEAVQVMVADAVMETADAMVTDVVMEIQVVVAPMQVDVVMAVEATVVDVTAVVVTVVEIVIAVDVDSVFCQDLLEIGRNQNVSCRFA